MFTSTIVRRLFNQNMHIETFISSVLWWPEIFYLKKKKVSLYIVVKMNVFALKDSLVLQ